MGEYMRYHGRLSTTALADRSASSTFLFLLVLEPVSSLVSCHLAPIGGFWYCRLCDGIESCVSLCIHIMPFGGFGY